MNHKPHIVTEQTARMIADWLRTRNGIAIWESIDMSRPDASVTTPVNGPAGHPTAKPYHWVASEPACIITDPDDVLVSKDIEVKRFHVAVRLGAYGFKVKCTDASTRRIRREVEKAGKGAYYEFDYATQEAVIMKPETAYTPLPDWLAAHAPAA